MGDRVVDLAGVGVRLHTSDDERAPHLDAAVAGFPTGTGPAVATVSVDGRRVAPPDRPPRSSLGDVRFWNGSGGVVVAVGDVVIETSGATVAGHVPDVAAGADFARGANVGLAWVLAEHRRFVLHAGAVERNGRGLLVLGTSGAGKSTLVLAALEAGWRALADDQVLVAGGPDAPTVHGFHRPPSVPLELGGRLATGGRLLDDPRQRVRLDRGLLTAGGFPVAGVVVVGHATDPEGSLRPVDGTGVLPLLLQSFPASIDGERRSRFFPTATAISRLPAWHLGHAADPTRRRERAAHLLDRCQAG